MLEGLLAVVITVVVLGALIPLGLCYLLARQVVPTRPLRSLLIVAAFTIAWGPVGLLLGVGLVAMLQRRWTRRRRTARTTGSPSGIGRRWAQLVGDAEAARTRFRLVVESCQPGPLRDGLRDTLREVDAAVAEAARLAEQGDRTERAHHDVLTALDAQRRRRRRRDTALPGDLEASLADATRAQHESAERLAAAAARDLTRLQLVVARLHELTATALEVTTVAGAMPELSAAAATADRLTALRLATAEVSDLART